MCLISNLHRVLDRIESWKLPKLDLVYFGRFRQFNSDEYNFRLESIKDFFG